MAVAAAVAALATPGAACAQDLRFTHLGTEEGLASSTVLDIYQDSRGFMWFSTLGGLNRYNGYTMELFRARSGDTLVNIPTNRVYAIAEDRAGALWLGTPEGLSRFDRATSRFTNFKIPEGARGRDQLAVYSIVEDRGGTLWIGATGDLLRFDRATGKSTRQPLPATRDGATTAFVRALMVSPRTQRLWIGAERVGLLELDPGTGKIRHFQFDPADSTSLPENDVRTIAEDSTGQIWVGMNSHGIARLNPVTGRFVRYRHNPADPRSLSADQIRRLVWDRRESGLWIATESGGLERFDPLSGEFHHHRGNPNNPSAPSTDSYWSLYQDAGGTLWAGTFSTGLDILQPGSAAIRLHRSIPGDTTTLGHNSVMGFAEDSAGIVWVATDGGGLDRLDRRTGVFRHYTTRNTNLNAAGVLAAAVDHKGGVWVGTWHGGVSRLDPRTGRFTAYTTKNSNIPSNDIFSVHVDRRGRLWAGTHHDGLILFDETRRSFTHYPLPVAAQTQIWLIRELRDGRLLLGTLGNGMVLFDPTTGAMQQYDTETAGPAALLGYSVRALLEAEPGVVWVGSGAGLDRLDLRTSAITHFTEDDGLPSSTISGLALDGAGKLWVSTDQGLARFDPATKRTDRYTMADGLQGREFNPRAYLQTRDGAMLFGGNNGFNVVRPWAIAHNERRPPVMLAGFQLFNKPVTVGSPGSPLQRHISETDHVTLQYDQSVFGFEFAALDFRVPGKNRYAYKLEGFDRDWTYSGTVRSATYTNLPPSEYVFHVRGTNNDGVWNDEGKSVRITIVPPFWMTWWFRTLVGLIVVAAVALIVSAAYRRRRNLERMNAQLAGVAERDRENQRSLEHNVLDILDAMHRFAGGDYSVALAVESDDAIGKLRQGLNIVVADLRRVEEELRQSQKMEAVGRLAGGIAHDFNNLLTVIKGNVALALADLGSTPSLREERELREELEEVERAADRAGGLTQQLLAFSRKQVLQPRVLQLNDNVLAIARMLRRTVGEDVVLELSLDPALSLVRADPGQVEQVLLNLAVNARDAMPRGGVLTITTHNVDAATVRHHPEAENVPYVSLTVRDTGTGMPAHVRERIFEPFFTTKEQGKGTGLGLSSAYGSIKQSGGYVLVESEEGVGTMFSIFLPQVSGKTQETPAAVAPVESAQRASRTATLLLVEDEDALRRMASRVLERSGYTVLSASGGKAALALALECGHSIDLLLTDVVMPGMSGGELAERLLPQQPGMGLLYMSGYTEDAIVHHGVSSEGAALLEKPFSPDALLRKVREVLDANPALHPVLSAGPPA